MQLTLELDNATYWRLYCRATEHARSMSEEIAALIDSGSCHASGNAEQQLKAARAIRARTAEVQSK